VPAVWSNESGDAGKNRTEMASRAREHEEMPDKMAVANAAISEEQQAGGVSNPAGEKPDHRFQRDRQSERANHNKDEPAHPEIKNEGQLLQPHAGPKFYDHADDREQPDEHEHGPAQSPAERSQGERRVSPGDEKKNRGMIDDLKRAFEAGLRPGVVERRAKVEQPHRSDEDDRADEECLIRLPRRGHAKERGRDDRGRQAEPVADAIRDFFAPGLVPFRRGKEFVDRFQHTSDRESIAI
jgi:hypothetical protein